MPRALRLRTEALRQSAWPSHRATHGVRTDERGRCIRVQVRESRLQLFLRWY